MTSALPFALLLALHLCALSQSVSSFFMSDGSVTVLHLRHATTKTRVLATVHRVPNIRRPDLIAFQRSLQSHVIIKNRRLSTFCSRNMARYLVNSDRDHGQQQQLNRRLIPTDGILNARDCATAMPSPVPSNGEAALKVQLRPNAIYRMSNVATASKSDVQNFLLPTSITRPVAGLSETNTNSTAAGIFDDGAHSISSDYSGIRTYIDLRSEKEWKRDGENLMRPDLFGTDLQNIVWSRSGSIRQALTRNIIRSSAVTARELLPGEKPFQIKTNRVNGSRNAPQNAVQRQRHFVPFINEISYGIAVSKKLLKRDFLYMSLLGPGALFSRRCRSELKRPIMNYINTGGLVLMNEIILQQAGSMICTVLTLCADPTNYPIALYCTAGKDRTGLIVAILLQLCDVSLDDIVADYKLSKSVYDDMDDDSAMVGALAQHDLNPTTFLDAPAGVMRDTLQYIDTTYGGIEEYCRSIGFSTNHQQKLRSALLLNTRTTSFNKETRQ